MAGPYVFFIAPHKAATFAREDLCVTVESVLTELTPLDFAVGDDACSDSLRLAILDLAVVNPLQATFCIARQSFTAPHISHTCLDLVRSALRLRQPAKLALVLPVVAVQHCREYGIRRDLLAVAAEEGSRALADGRLQALEITLGLRTGLLHVQHVHAADMGRAHLRLGNDCFVLQFNAVRDLGFDLGLGACGDGQHAS
ncbi:hypothetical protein D3C87_1465310 [compost metagenome]